MFSQLICLVQLKTAWKSELSYKTGDFFLVIRNYLRPSNNSRQLVFKINCCCFDSDNLLRFMKMVKCLPEFEYFYCILEK